MKLISNCSPLIFLAKINFLELLEKDEIIIPSEVKEELLFKESVEKDRLEKFFSSKNVQIIKVLAPRKFSESLGKGELSVINLALENKITDILMDDRRGRSLAKIHNLKPHGTIWIIMRSYKKGLLTKAQTKDLICELPSIGFRIDPEFLFQLLKTL